MIKTVNFLFAIRRSFLLFCEKVAAKRVILTLVAFALLKVLYQPKAYDLGLGRWGFILHFKGPWPLKFK
jgi:hypothetical protein